MTSTVDSFTRRRFTSQTILESQGPVERFKSVLQRALIFGRFAWLIRRRRQENQLLAQQTLVGVLRDARGTAMKAGQLLAGLEGSDPMQALADGVEPLSLAEIRPVIARRMGVAPQELFDRIEASEAAASLGQVHRAHLRHGGEVAIKVLYPGIRQAVAAELALLKRMPAAGPIRRFGIDLDAYVKALEENMAEELDYESEARRQEDFRRRVRYPGLVVPIAFTGLCSEGILVQSWEEGQPLREAALWNVRDRRRLASILLGSVLRSIFSAGLIHADPHAGNVRCRRGTHGPELVLYDFGCLMELDERRRLALLRLIIGLREGDGLDVAACLVELGFDAKKLMHLSVDLTNLCRLLFEPFLIDRSYDLGAWNLGSRMSSLLSGLSWWLRSAGPPESLFLLRAFLGLTEHLKTLGINMRWWSTLCSVVGSDIEKARSFEPDPLPEELEDLRQSPRPKSRRLCLQVTDGDRETLRIDLPAMEVLHLETIIPETARRHLEEAGVDLLALADKTYRRGMEPGPVVSHTEGEKHYRLWLE